MDERTRPGERTELALIGVGVAIGVLLVVGIVTGDGEWWRWLMLGAPVALVLGAVARLRRIRGTGRTGRR